MGLRIAEIAVDGYASLRHAELAIGPLTVLIGANGSGKSNLVGAVGLLGAIADRRLADETADRAFDLFHRGPPQANEIGLSLTSTDEDRSLSYVATLAAGSNGGLVVETEVVELTAEEETQTFEGGPIAAVEPVNGDDASDLEDPRRLGESTLAGSAVPVVQTTMDVMRGVTTLHLADTSRTAPVKQQQPIYGDGRGLAINAANLAEVLFDLRQENPAAYERIRFVVQQIAPFFEDFVLEPEGGYIRLRWRQSGVASPMSAHSLSDGTLRFMCLATLLLQPRTPGLILLDEPELGLHPAAIRIVAELLETAAFRSQIIAATQSAALIDQFSPDSDRVVIYTVTRDQGSTTFERLRFDKLRDWLDEYSIGELWEKSVIAGQPVAETTGE